MSMSFSISFASARTCFFMAFFARLVASSTARSIVAHHAHHYERRFALVEHRADLFEV
jgi:hypothetical protein